MSGEEADSPEQDQVVTAALAGDESAFAQIVARHRRELQVHCYRMLGSYEDSEDLLQETFLRAWRKRDTFQGRSTFRAWLYRIATNACLDSLARSPRRVLPHQLRPSSESEYDLLPPTTEIPWLQPYPDHLLEGIAATDDEPDVVVVAKETIELAFVAAIQHLPARQRAVLILRDVLGWSAKETATLLEGSVASVNSALQRARATLKEELPERRTDWTPTVEPSAEEKELVQRYLEAFERVDPAAVADLLAEDAKFSMPPWPLWWRGRHTIAKVRTDVIDPGSPRFVGHWRFVPIRGNRQPGFAHYVQRPGDDTYRAIGMELLSIRNRQVVEITAFDHTMFPPFGLPLTL